MVSTDQPPDPPEDHKRLTLDEDWVATLLGLLLFGLCMLGLIGPELIP